MGVLSDVIWLALACRNLQSAVSKLLLC